MTRRRTWYLNLREKFPADQPIAGLMARLMVLWADMLLEYTPIGAEAEGRGSAYEMLDRLGPLYRRIYFWRGLTRTIYSAQQLFNQLMADKDFRKWMKESPNLGDSFIQEKRAFDRVIRDVVALRNRVGAHVEEHVGDAPKHLIDGMVGPIELGGGDVMRPHLAVFFVLATLLPGIPAEKHHERLDELLTTVKSAQEAMVRAMMAALELYNARYNLFP